MGNTHAAEPAVDDEFADEPATDPAHEPLAPASLWNSFARFTPNFRDGMTRAIATSSPYPRLQRTLPTAAELAVVRAVTATEPVDFSTLLPPEIISRILNQTDGEVGASRGTCSMFCKCV